MNTVSWQYARRRKHLAPNKPHRYRYYLISGVYLPILPEVPKKWVLKVTKGNREVIEAYRGVTIPSHIATHSEGCWVTNVMMSFKAGFGAGLRNYRKFREEGAVDITTDQFLTIINL